MKTAPSINRLCRELQFTREQAELVRHIWKDAKRAELIHTAEKIGIELHHGYIENLDFLRMLIIDRIGEFYGVEHLGEHKRTGYDVEYCNAGDTYNATIIFHGNAMQVNCYGDLVERDLIRSNHYY